MFLLLVTTSFALKLHAISTNKVEFKEIALGIHGLSELEGE